MSENSHLKFDKREKHRIYNTLSSVPIALIGHSVLIDLHNFRSVAGRVVTVDGFMNISLEEVVLIDKTGKQYPYDQFMIKSESIKQIFLPEEFTEKDFLDINSTILRKSQKPQKSEKQTLKQKRTFKKHQEVLQEIASGKASKQ